MQHSSWSHGNQSTLACRRRGLHQPQEGPLAAVEPWVCYAIGVGKDQCQPTASRLEQATEMNALGPLSTTTARKGRERTRTLQKWAPQPSGLGGQPGAGGAESNCPVPPSSALSFFHKL